ncbi:hypothetical protein LguiA_001706 [Lonicera macranthoides]
MESQWLPNDIILQILSKLPVKSLLRFRSVCKDWCSSIFNPKFTLSTQRRGRVVVESVWKGTQIVEEETVLDSIDSDGVSIERLVKPWEEKQQQQYHHQDLHLLGFAVHIGKIKPQIQRLNFGLLERTYNHLVAMNGIKEFQKYSLPSGKDLFRSDLEIIPTKFRKKIQSFTASKQKTLYSLTPLFLTNEKTSSFYRERA